MEQFRIEAEEQAKQLILPEQKLLADRMAAFSESWARAAIMLPAELI